MKEQFIGVTPEQFQDFNQLPLEGTFQMVNLLKFKDHVEETGTSGAEAYTEYMKAVAPFFQESKAKIVYIGKPLFTVIGPQNTKEWDKILIVEYASKAAFLKMISNEGYPTALRSRALEDSRLILCTS